MSKETEWYLSDISGIMRQIHEELPAVTRIAKMMADAVEKDQLIHVVGTGGHCILWRFSSFLVSDSECAFL